MKKQLLTSLLVVLFLPLVIFNSCREDESPLPVIETVTPGSDGIGAVVKIEGKNFGAIISEASLEFNGTPALIDVIADTLITTHVPEGATTGKINLTVRGKRTSSPQDFEILEGRWERKADMIEAPPGTYDGQGRYYAVGFTIGGKGYIGTGNDPPVPLKDFHEYDPALNQWARKADQPLARYQASAFVISNKAYVGLGRDDSSGYLSDFYEYDPATDTWTEIASFPGGGRASATSFSIGGKGYVGMGLGPRSYKDLWAYDPATDEWAQLADFPGTARGRAVGISVDEKGYVGLGFLYFDWWRYDPVLDSWTRLADSILEGKNLPWDITWFAMNGKIYILGGYSANCWEYDPALDKWQQRTSIPQTFGGGSSFSIGDKGYVTTRLYSAPDKLWEFDLN